MHREHCKVVPHHREVRPRRELRAKTFSRSGEGMRRVRVFKVIA